MDTRKGRTSSHGFWFRIVLNALCLWSDVSRGHGHLHLLDLCPSSETASLLTETETYGGCGSEGGVVMIYIIAIKQTTQTGLLVNVMLRICLYPFLRRP